MSYSKEEMEKDLKNYYDKKQKTLERAEKVLIVHEDLIVVERLDVKILSTWLVTDPAADKENQRNSWYARVLKVSNVNSQDSVKELKKTLLKPGDIVSVNPDVPYSLNIKDHYEIWVLSVDNVLGVDTGFDPDKMMEENLRVRHERFGKPLI